MEKKLQVLVVSITCSRRNNLLVNLSVPLTETRNLWTVFILSSRPFLSDKWTLGRNQSIFSPSGPSKDATAVPIPFFCSVFFARNPVKWPVEPDPGDLHPFKYKLQIIDLKTGVHYSSFAKTAFWQRKGSSSHSFSFFIWTRSMLTLLIRNVAQWIAASLPLSPNPATALRP